MLGRAIWLLLTSPNQRPTRTGTFHHALNQHVSILINLYLKDNWADTVQAYRVVRQIYRTPSTQQRVTKINSQLGPFRRIYSSRATKKKKSRNFIFTTVRVYWNLNSPISKSSKVNFENSIAKVHSTEYTRLIYMYIHFFYGPQQEYTSHTESLEIIFLKKERRKLKNKRRISKLSEKTNAGRFSLACGNRAAGESSSLEWSAP